MTFNHCKEAIARWEGLVVASGGGDPLPSAQKAACWNCGLLGAASDASDALAVSTSNLKCSRCKRAYYCNEACQKAHWVHHKSSCMQ